VFFTEAARARAGKHQPGHHSVAFSIKHVPVAAVVGRRPDSGAGSHWASESTSPESKKLHHGILQPKYM